MFVRLAFAAAINVDPDILILDEVLAVGDMAFQHRCITKIRKLQRNKVILFVSHDLDAVVNFCDEIIWLKSGMVEEIGDPKTLSEHYLAYMYELSNRSFLRKSAEIGIAKSLPAAPAKTGSSIYIPKPIGETSRRFGDRAATISGIEIVDRNGTRLDTIWAGTSINVAIMVDGVQDVSKPIVGFRVRNRLGQEIFSTNTEIEGYILPPLKPGIRGVVNFVFSWPYLAPGSYSFSAAIADGSLAEHVMEDWVEDALVLQSDSHKKIIGMIGVHEMTVVYATA